MVRPVFVLAALTVWSAAVGLTDAARVLSQLPNPSASACQFTDSNSGLLTDAFLAPSNWLLVTPQAAMGCFNAIQLDYDLVNASIDALAEIFERTYVFAALAADPAGTPQSNNFGFKVFDGKVDIPKELRDLAKSFTENTPVALGSVVFPMNELFNRLRDAHVSYGGSGGTTFGGVLPAMTGGASVKGAGRAYLVDSRTSAIVTDIQISSNSGGGLQFGFIYFFPDTRKNTYVPIVSIDEGPPMDTLVSWANNPVFSWKTKALGTRINEVIDGMNNLRVTKLGDVTKLKSIKVDYGNGTSSTVNWGITMAPSLDDNTLSDYQTTANTPGVPIKALLEFVETYTSKTALPAPPPAPESEPLEVTRPATKRSGARVALVPLAKYGFYFISGTTATLKLNTFSFKWGDLASWWPGFIQAASKQNARKLILDLTNNGGGTIATGMVLALALYPDASIDDFGVSYDRIIGPEAAYAYENGLTPSALALTYLKVISNTTYLQERTVAINTNATELDRLTRLTVGTFDAITSLFNTASPNQIQACRNPSTNLVVNCADLWNSFPDRIQEGGIDSITKGNLNAGRLGDLLSGDFIAQLQAFWPYGGAGSSKASDPYLNPTKYNRGGYLRNYTGKYKLLPDASSSTFFGLRLGSGPQFDKILVVGNGYCGSTCDTFSKSAWFYSKANPSLPTFKYATFGGTGKLEDSGSTAFPGGNVNGDDLLTQAWAYVAIAILQAEWAGLPDLSTTIDKFIDYLPLFPSFLDSTTPRYTQSEIYRKDLGPDALPMEYYLIPPDYQIPAWYKQTDVPRPGAPLSQDLQDLYKEANMILQNM